MPNIRILALAIIQIFCSQGCSYTKCLCLKKGNKPTKNFWNRFISESAHLHLGLLLYAKYQNPSQIGSSDIFVHKFVPIQNAYFRKRGITQRKIYRIGSKVNQFIYILVCNCMPNTRILAFAVLQIFCSQGCSYIVEKGA